MIIFKEAAALRRHLAINRKKGSSIGFVPTMGALHEGHLSLVRLCRERTALTVCSIFVNPTQFNDPADFARYPATTSRDIRLLEQQQTDILFLPAVEEVYPSGTQQQQHYELGYLDEVLEAAHRPGHFQGVCQVVQRLLEIVQPDELVLGRKDFQQCMVIRKLVDLTGMPVKIIIGETLREASGLAMSSRNLRLTSDQRLQAAAIFEALQAVRSQIATKPFGVLQDEARSHLLQHGFSSVDYISIAETGSLRMMQPVDNWNGKTPLVALVAATIGGVRLIDNLALT